MVGLLTWAGNDRVFNLVYFVTTHSLVVLDLVRPKVLSEFSIITQNQLCVHSALPTYHSC